MTNPAAITATTDASEPAKRGSGSASGPERPIIYFDGVCGLCNRSVDFVLHQDRRQQFVFAPLQGETAGQRLGIVTGETLFTMVLEDETGVYRQSDAVWRVLVRLGGRWRGLGIALRLIPRCVRNWGYRFISRHRYQWFGRKEACRLPTPEERSRFLP